MIGHIESYDPDNQAGVVKSEENAYTFYLDDWVAQVPPDPGDDVTFEVEGGIARNITLVGAYLAPPKAVKYKYVAALLALFLGFTGLASVLFGVLLARHCPTGFDCGNGWLWSPVGVCRSYSAVYRPYRKRRQRAAFKIGFKIPAQNRKA